MAQLALLASMAPSAGSPLPPPPKLDDDITAMEARSSGVGSSPPGASSGNWIPDANRPSWLPDRPSWIPDRPSWIPAVPEKPNINIPNLNPFRKPTTTPAPPPSAAKGLTAEAKLIYWWFGILLAVYVLCAVLVVLLSVELFKMFNMSHILAHRTAYLGAKRKINLSGFSPSEQNVVPMRVSPSKPG